MGRCLADAPGEVFPPIPSELVMPFAGYLAAEGSLNFVVLIIARTAGSAAGAYLWYLVGARMSEERLRRLIERNRKWLTLTTADLDRALLWFRRHDGAAVFFGRMIPGVRTFISRRADRHVTMAVHFLHDCR